MWWNNIVEWLWTKSQAIRFQEKDFTSAWSGTATIDFWGQLKLMPTLKDCIFHLIHWISHLWCTSDCCWHTSPLNFLGCLFKHFQPCLNCVELHFLQGLNSGSFIQFPVRTIKYVEARHAMTMVCPDANKRSEGYSIHSCWRSLVPCMHGRRFLLILKKTWTKIGQDLVFHHQPQLRGSPHCCFSEYVLKITIDLFVNHGKLGLNQKLGLLLLFPSVGIWHFASIPYYVAENSVLFASNRLNDFAKLPAMFRSRLGHNWVPQQLDG